MVDLEKPQCDRGMPESFPIPLYDIATHCEKCGRPLSHPVHRDWYAMRARVSAQLVARETSWNPFDGHTPSLGLFQTMPAPKFGVDFGRDGDDVVVLGPVHDNLKSVRWTRWYSEFGDGELNADPS